MIRRSTLRAQLATALRDEILAGRLPAGSHFTVKEIAEQYGVSATPVREALVDLAAQGLLDVEQHRGYRVHEFTVDDYRAMVRARMVVLDGLFHGYSSDGEPPVPLRPLDTEVVASIRRRADAAERAARAGHLDVLIGYDLRYWRELGEVIANPYLCDFLDRLRVQCWVYAVPCLRRLPDVGRYLWAGHRDLLDAVSRDDSEEIGRLTSEHHTHALELADACRGGGCDVPGPTAPPGPTPR